MPFLSSLRNDTYRVPGWQAQDDDGRTLVVVDERPEVAGRVLDRPFRDDVLSWFGVALRRRVHTYKNEYIIRDENENGTRRRRDERVLSGRVYRSGLLRWRLKRFYRR